MQLKRLNIILFFLFLIIQNEEAFASHAMGVDLTYSCIGSSATHDTMQITLSFYRDCAGISQPATVTINFNSSCGSLTATLNPLPCGPPTTPGGTPCEVSPLCRQQISSSTCNGGTLPGVQQYIYTGTVVLQHCSDWNMSYSLCCRNAAITNLQNPDSEEIYVEATLNSSAAPCNSSPSFTSLPVPYICVNQPFFYNHGAVDVDGDSLVYSLVNPLAAGAAPIPYVSPFNVNYPMSTASGTFGFDPVTGQMFFTPNQTQVGVLTVLVEEYRNGVLIGSTMRDIQIVVINCTNNQPELAAPLYNHSGGVQITNRSIEICPGDSLTFTLGLSDPDGDSVYMTSNNALSLPGSNFIITRYAQDTLTGTITWYPTVADTGLHVLTITIRDNGCPTFASSVHSILINVLDRTFAGPDRYYCPSGGPQIIRVTGGTEFSWTPTHGIIDVNGPDSSVIWVEPDSHTTYIVTSDLSSNCRNTDTVTVYRVPDFQYTISPEDSICKFSSTQISVTADPRQGPYTYEWSPPNGLSNPNIRNPVASPLNTTTYYVTVTSDSGCRITDSVRVVIQGVAPNVIAYAEPDTVCPGGSVQLEAIGIPVSCGLSSSPCLTPNVDRDVGTSRNWQNSTTAYPAIYGNWFWGAKHQILYTAADLLAAGFVGGRINAISFEVAQINGTTTYTGFTIKMGCTNLSSLPAVWQTGLQTVFTPKTININAGWNTHILDFPFEWDGTSNIIIEVCFNNASYTSNSPNYYTPTSYNSVIYYRADNGTVCSAPGAPTTSTLRPNIRFATCQIGTPGVTYQWSPVTGLSDPTIRNPIATLVSTTTYTVDVDDGGCVGTNFVTVLVDTSISVTAGQDILACTLDSFQLSAQASGTPMPMDLTCGVNGTACGGNSRIREVGQATNTSSAESPFDGSWEDLRMQILYTATDLQNAGLREGVITEIAFNVQVLGSSNNPFQNLTIKMGCTAANSLGSNFEPGMVTVYNPRNVIITAGWNTFTLDNTFDWDGVSNVIVEICWDNPDNTIFGTDALATTPTSYTSVIKSVTVFSSGCNLTALSGLFSSYTNRPDTRFTLCDPPPGQFQYTWTPSINLNDTTLQNPTFYATTPGVYQYVVSVTDGFCIANDTIVVTVDSCNCRYTARVNYVSCAGFGDGSIKLQVSGGTPPYTIQWVGGATGDSIGGLSPGIYAFTITDADQCVINDSIEITEPLPLSLNIQTQDASCTMINGGRATAIVTGGTTPYQFMWNTIPPQYDSIARNLVAGSYTVTVTDTNGCTITGNAVINGPQPILYNITTRNVSCNGYNDGYAVADVYFGSAPFTYQWSTTPPSNSDSAGGLFAGTYYLTISDSSGCSVYDTIIISEPAPLVIQKSKTDTRCNGDSTGSAMVTVTGGTPPYIYFWSNGQNTNAILNIPAGAYSITVTDSVGCQATDTVNVLEPPPLTVSFMVNDARCAGSQDGQITAIPAGGTPSYEVTWSNGQSGLTDTALSTGTYTALIRDDNGCTLTDSATVAEPLPLTDTLVKTDVSCYGGSDGTAKISAAGGTAPYTYQWNTSAVTDSIYNLPAGLYTVTVTDSNGCTLMDSVVIEQPDSFVISITTIDVSCPGGSDGEAIASVNGDTTQFSFVWNTIPPQNTARARNLSAGTYQVMVTVDSTGCTQSASAVISEPPAIDLLITGTDVSCAGGNNGMLNVTVNSGGLPPFSYLWSDGQNTAMATGLMAGSYTVTVTDANGCTATDTGMVSEPAPLTLATLLINNPGCNGGADGSISITVTGGTPPYTYNWSNGATNSTNPGLSSGTYTFTVTDANNCILQDTAVVPEPGSLEILAIITEDATCPDIDDGSISLLVTGGTPPYTYQLGQMQAQSTPEFYGLAGDSTYFITITDANNCRVDTSVYVDAPPVIDVSFPVDVVDVVIGEDLVLTPVIVPFDSSYTYLWEPPTGLSNPYVLNPIADPYVTTNYQITVFDSNGCEYTDNITVVVENQLILFVPNAFSPDGDDNNDVLMVYGQAIKSIDFRIFDRWGELIFRSTDINQGWDGTYKGESLPPGVYTYFVEVEYLDNYKKAQKGSITLLR